MSSENAWLTARNLLVVRMDNAGDIVMLGPALRAINRSCSLGEELEDSRQQIFFDADSVVAHLDRRPTLGYRQREIDAGAVVGVLRRIVEQVANDLRKPHRIAIAPHRFVGERHQQPERVRPDVEDCDSHGRHSLHRIGRQSSAHEPILAMVALSAAITRAGSGANCSFAPNFCPGPIAYVRKSRSDFAFDELCGTSA